MCIKTVVTFYVNDFAASYNSLFNKNPLTGVLSMCTVALNIKTAAVMKHKFAAFSVMAKEWIGCDPDWECFDMQFTCCFGK